MTQDLIWVYIHATSMRKTIIDYILSQREHFEEGENGLVKQDVLNDYGITCPNKCSHQGECLKSKFIN